MLILLHTNYKTNKNEAAQTDYNGSRTAVHLTLKKTNKPLILVFCLQQDYIHKTWVK